MPVSRKFTSKQGSHSRARPTFREFQVDIVFDDIASPKAEVISFPIPYGSDALFLFTLNIADVIELLML